MEDNPLYQHCNILQRQSTQSTIIAPLESIARKIFIMVILNIIFIIISIVTSALIILYPSWRDPVGTIANIVAADRTMIGLSITLVTANEPRNRSGTIQPPRGSSFKKVLLKIMPWITWRILFLTALAFIVLPGFTGWNQSQVSIVSIMPPLIAGDGIFLSSRLIWQHYAIRLIRSSKKKGTLPSFQLDWHSPPSWPLRLWIAAPGFIGILSGVSEFFIYRSIQISVEHSKQLHFIHTFELIIASWLGMVIVLEICPKFTKNVVLRLTCIALSLCIAGYLISTLN